MKFYNSLSVIQKDLLSGELDLQKLLAFYITRIEETKSLNAYLEVFNDSAYQKAAEVVLKIKEKKQGKLAGLIIAIKDNICYKDHKVSAASKMLENYTSIYSATVVERLLEEDAIIIGRLNCDEFAMGATNESSYFGPVRNYADQSKVSGGSSGGCAVAVQANLCLAALGTDTGGSIRQPAAFCGVYGFKPTYGRISRHGIIAYASSFDQVGLVTQNVEDAAEILAVIAGKDAYDSTASNKEVSAYNQQLNLKKPVKIAYLKEALERDGLEEEIKTAFFKKIDQLREEGNEVKAVSFQYLDHVVPTYYILTTAEASANLSRYGGVHYGYRSKNAATLESTYKKSRSEGFGDEVKRRIMLGTFVLSAGYYDAYYANAQKLRRLIQEKTLEILENYDFILLPTAPTVAFDIGKKEEDAVAGYLADIYTVQASLAGLPAMSVPLGNNSVNLPFGLQILSKHFEEDKLLAFAQYVSTLNKTHK